MTWAYVPLGWRDAAPEQHLERIVMSVAVYVIHFVALGFFLKVLACAHEFNSGKQRLRGPNSTEIVVSDV